jgi:hypothetical protein
MNKRESLNEYPKWHTGPFNSISDLRVGDVIQHQVGFGSAYHIIKIEDGRVFAVKEVEVTNPSEWLRVIVDGTRRGGEHGTL